MGIFCIIYIGIINLNECEYYKCIRNIFINLLCFMFDSICNSKKMKKRRITFRKIIR